MQSEVASAQIERRYEATGEGRTKLCIGVGGINCNRRIGDKIFEWVNGDRAEFIQSTQTEKSVHHSTDRSYSKYELKTCKKTIYFKVI